MIGSLPQPEGLDEEVQKEQMFVVPCGTHFLRRL